MGCRIAVFAVVLIAFASAANAHGDPKPPCDSHDAGAAACVERAMHLMSAAAFRARGDEMIRVMDPSQNTFIVVEAVMPRRGDGRLTAWRDGETLLRHSWVLPRTLFEALRAKLLKEPGEVAVLYGAKAAPYYYGSDDGEICLNRYLWIQGAIGGAAANAVSGSCELADARFVGDVEALLEQTDPDCKDLNGTGPADDSARPCMRLAGDRTRAAQAFRASLRLVLWGGPPGTQDGQHTPDVAEIAATIAPDASLTLYDAKPVHGAGAIAAEWLRLRAKSLSEPYHLTGALAHDDVVDVYGTIDDYETTSPSRGELAFTQTWSQRPDGNWQLQVWRFYPQAPPD